MNADCKNFWQSLLTLLFDIVSYWWCLSLIIVSRFSCPPRSFLPALCHIFMDETAPDSILEVTARAITYYLDVSAECSRRIVTVDGAIKALCTRLVVVDISARTSKDLAEQCVKVRSDVFFLFEERYLSIFLKCIFWYKELCSQRICCNKMSIRKYWLVTRFYPAGNYMFKVNSRNTRTRCEICSKLTIKIPERRQWRRSGIFC